MLAVVLEYCADFDSTRRLRQFGDIGLTVLRPNAADASTREILLQEVAGLVFHPHRDRRQQLEGALSASRALSTTWRRENVFADVDEALQIVVSRRTRSLDGNLSLVDLAARIGVPHPQQRGGVTVETEAATSFVIEAIRQRNVELLSLAAPLLGRSSRTWLLRDLAGAAVARIQPDAAATHSNSGRGEPAAAQILARRRHTPRANRHR